MRTYAQSAALLACATIALCSASCTTTTKQEALMPTGVSTSTRTGKPINATVVGGSELTSIGGAGVTNEDFKQALETSLVQSGMFTHTGGGGYSLEAFIANIDQPVIGFAMRVNMDVSYTLRRGGTTVWQKSIRSTYEAATSEAFAGVVRLRKATEGAARENIKQLMHDLDRRL